MSIKDKLKLLLQEADLYKSQRLLNESREKYLLAADLIRKNERIQNRDTMLNIIAKKIESLDKALNSWDKSEAAPEVSGNVQDLIKDLFTEKKNNESESVNALRQAITLADFGQYKRALEEFESLLPDKNVGVSAAKKILKYHILKKNPGHAAQLHQTWSTSGLFDAQEMGRIRTFLENICRYRSIEIDLTGEEAKDPFLFDNVFEESSSEDEDIIDITSIGITLDDEKFKGQNIELDVSFQAGNVLSLIISGKLKELIETLQVGVKLTDMDFYSPIAIFKGCGVVESSTQITSGPKRGDYSLDIKISSL